MDWILWFIENPVGRENVKNFAHLSFQLLVIKKREKTFGKISVFLPYPLIVITPVYTDKDHSVYSKKPVNATQDSRKFDLGKMQQAVHAVDRIK